MASLQKPKKLVLVGQDGRKYPFLCKPNDDLRKDARLMDFNSMINKLLNSASESRRRQLCEHCSARRSRSVLIADIRTYAVMPLNEECGLLEWVSNTSALKTILDKGYARYGKKTWVSESFPLTLIASHRSSISSSMLRPKARTSTESTSSSARFSLSELLALATSIADDEKVSPDCLP